MNEDQIKAKEEYLEVFGYNGEIEFMYNNHFYHIEPDYDEEGTYEIWKSSKMGSGDGKIIARCNPPESVLDVKVFEGKTILEIEDEMTDCILR